MSACPGFLAFRALIRSFGESFELDNQARVPKPDLKWVGRSLKTKVLSLF